MPLRERAERPDQRSHALHAVVEAPHEEQVATGRVEAGLAAGAYAVERPVELRVDDAEEERNAAGVNTEMRRQLTPLVAARDQQAARARERRALHETAVVPLGAAPRMIREQWDPEPASRSGDHVEAPPRVVLGEDVIGAVARELAQEG